MLSAVPPLDDPDQFEKSWAAIAAFSPAQWAIFGGIVVVLVALVMFAVNKRDRRGSQKTPRQDC